MAKKLGTPKKIGFLTWEVEVEDTENRTIYYFQGWTRKGCLKEVQRYFAPVK